MASLPSYMQPHAVTVRPLTGATGTGDVLGAAVAVQCFRESKVRLVRSAGGNEVVSSATIYTSEPASLFPPGSEVSWSGGSGKVITTTEQDDGGVMAAWRHTEVALT